MAPDDGGDAGRRQGIGLDRQVGERVDGRALRQQGANPRQWVRGIKQRTHSAGGQLAAEPLQNGLRSRLQSDDEAGAEQQPAVLLPDRGTSAGGNHAPLAHTGLRDRRTLDGAKVCLAILGKDALNGLTGQARR